MEEEILFIFCLLLRWKPDTGVSYMLSLLAAKLATLFQGADHFQQNDKKKRHVLILINRSSEKSHSSISIGL